MNLAIISCQNITGLGSLVSLLVVAAVAAGRLTVYHVMATRKPEVLNGYRMNCCGICLFVHLDFVFTDI